MPDIFLSYSREDQATARRFAEAFQREGLTVWWDQTLNPGEAFDEVTEKALSEAKAVVVLWSKHSVASRWVRAEATQANDTKTLVPVMIEPCKRPIMFELTHTADLSHWVGDASDAAWQSYLAGVKRMVGKGEPIKPSAQTTGAAHVGRRFSAKSLSILIAVLVVVGVVLWAVNNRIGEKAAPASPAAAVRDSIAVMPFANLTGDPSKDYLGDGMSEELLNVLAKVPGLKVPSRTSSFAYKGRNTDLKQIAKDLQVGTILEGSVRSAGETIRVTAQLIDAQTDRHLWSETYDRKFTDLFQLQDDLAKAIVQALQLNLKGASPAVVAQAPPTQDVEAYRLYLQGWSLFNRSTEPEMRDAIDLFKQALARDPKFARAWSALAETRTVFLVIGYPLPHALDDAEKEATQALSLDPRLASANAVLGTISAMRGKWLEAETLFRNAIARDASDPLILGDYSGNLLDSVGYLRQSLANRRKAYQLAPADIGVLLNLSVGLSLMGNDADALTYADLMIKLGLSPDVVPVPIIYANAYTRSGHYSEAADRVAIMLPPKLRAAGSDTVIKDVYAALGESARRPAAIASLQSLVKKVKAEDLDVNTRKVLIGMFTGLDALDVAFRFADQSLDYFARTGTFGSDWGLLWVPEMRPFRRDPRFQAFVTRMGLMDYWNKYGPPDDCDLTNGRLTCH